MLIARNVMEIDRRSIRTHVRAELVRRAREWSSGGASDSRAAKEAAPKKGEKKVQEEERKFVEVSAEKVTANAHCPCGLRALHKHNETRLSVDLSDLRVG